MRYILTILTFFFLSCYIVRARENQDDNAEKVTFCELSKNPSSFTGKRIRIRAIFRYAFEIQSLESPTCCPDPGIHIWVEIEASLANPSQKLFHKFPKGQGVVLATFVGKFDGEGAHGTFADKYKLSVDQIEKVERTVSSSRRQDDPKWVPKDCSESNTVQPKQNSSALPHEAQSNGSE